MKFLPEVKIWASTEGANQICLVISRYVPLHLLLMIPMSDYQHPRSSQYPQVAKDERVWNETDQILGPILVQQIGAYVAAPHCPFVQAPYRKNTQKIPLRYTCPDLIRVLSTTCEPISQPFCLLETFVKPSCWSQILISNLLRSLQSAPTNRFFSPQSQAKFHSKSRTFFHSCKTKKLKSTSSFLLAYYTKVKCCIWNLNPSCPYFNNNARDFLFRLTYLHNYRIKYLQIDNGSEWEKYFVQEVKKRKITLVYNYPKSPKMNAFIERVNGTVQTEYLDRFYEETSVSKINEILYNCLIEYNFYRPHRSLNLLTPIEYCSKLNNRDVSMVQMYWTQTSYIKFYDVCYNTKRHG